MSKKYFYTAFIVIVIAMGSYVLIRANKNISPAEFLGPTAVTTTTTARVSEPTPRPIQQTQTKTPASTATNVPETIPTPTPNITLAVGGNSYATFASTGSTVLDAMRVLASTGDFTFTGKDYPSLGFFVGSINGKKAENGHNWILYVNGKLSGTGASQTTLNAGDALEWRYEISY